MDVSAKAFFITIIFVIVDTAANAFSSKPSTSTIIFILLYFLIEIKLRLEEV